MLTAERSATPMPDSRVGLYYDPLFLGHDTVGHIESIERVAGPLRLLEESGVAGRMVRRRPAGTPRKRKLSASMTRD